jgi:hypothetical protein
MPRIKHLLLICVFAALALGAANPRCASVIDPGLPAGDGTAAPAPADVNFLTVCLFSHRAADDPIVAPNLPGGSHSHDFFGNRSTNATSTHASLVANKATTCNRTGDTAAYWAPSLLVDGRIVQPARINAYYRPAGKDPASLEAFPAGLKVVAGNAKATTAQDLRIVSWGCASPEMTKPSATPPVCPFDGNSGALKLRIRFPDCWNGRDLDSADHASHMAYSRRGTCPDAHPVPVPAITMNVFYPTAGGAGAVLASNNSPYTGHADFFNAWDQATLETLMDNCLRATVQCGAKGGGVPLQKVR